MRWRTPFLTIVGLLASAPLLAAVTTTRGPELAWSEHPHDASQLELTFTLPDLQWHAEGAGVRPVIGGFGAREVLGEPSLPLRRERVALPPGGVLAIVDLSIEWHEGIVPGPLARFSGRDAELTEVTLPSGWWPSEVLRVVTPATRYRRLAFGVLELSPMQVDLETGRFRLAKSIRVSLQRDAARSADWGAAQRSTARSGPLDLELEMSGGEFALGMNQVGRIERERGLQRAESLASAGNFPAWQFEIKQDGVYRITHAWAQANAPGLFAFLTANDPNRYRLMVQGVEVPLLLEADGDATFEAGEAFQFYGQMVGRIDPFSADIYQSGDYTNTNVYRLDIASGAMRVANRSGARGPISGYQVPASFRTVIHHEPNIRHRGVVPQDGTDHWYLGDAVIWSADGTDNEFDDETIATPGYHSGSVTLRSNILGLTSSGSNNPSRLHRTELTINGTLCSTADWDGYRLQTLGVDTAAISCSVGSLPANSTVRARQQLRPGTTSDAWVLNWHQLEYDRRYQVDSGDSSLFDVANQNRELRVSGFSSLGRVYELTKSTVSAAGMAIAIPELIAGATIVAGEIRFEIDADGQAPAKRQFIAVGGNGYLTPAATREDQQPSTLDASLGASLKSAGLGADWVVIGHRPFLNMANGSQLRALIARRQGQGLDTAVIDLKDLYDEFTDGIEDPEAIRRFVDYALDNWSPAPSFIVLVGDATRDYLNNYGYGSSRQFVPTHMVDVAADQQFSQYLSDTWFAATEPGTELPQAVISRVPAHTLAEAEEIFRKIVAYETAPADNSWMARALLISQNDATNQEFLRVHNDIFDLWYAGKPQTATKVYQNTPSDCTGVGSMNDRIDLNVNQGAALISYAGHGGFQSWGGGSGGGCTFWQTASTGADDLADITNTSKLNFQVHANCITGHFASDNSTTASDTQLVFLEDWMLTSNKGAIGGLAPSHLAFTFELDSILQPVYEELWGRRKTRLVGDIERRLRSDFDQTGRLILLRSFVLLGDGATTLRLPAPGAPAISAIDKQGSGQLRIQWNAVAGASKYRVYRSEIPNGSYTMAGETTNLSLVDNNGGAGLQNCREYFYYVTAVDSANFESRWSNFNQTCSAVRDPQDCKTGTPEDPNAPAAPTLTAVTDTQQGGRLLVEWTPAPGATGIVNYTVLWGTAPGIYTSGQQSVGGSATSVTIGGLQDGTRYYVVVRAATCSKTGALSNERNAVPHRVEGINPPRSIRDLRVMRDPGNANNVKLTWTVPAETVWGTPTTISSIEIYADQASPLFPIDAAHRIATLAGTATQFLHTGQYPAAVGGWYYTVVAIDSSGRRSAAGTELPQGIEDLRVQKLNATQLRLSWGAITRSIDQRRLVVVGYNVYGQSGNLPRTGCNPGNRLVSRTPSLQSTLGIPAGSYFTYQVLAEDSYGGEAVW
jgi:fibronectin type 3 domain-containing protein